MNIVQINYKILFSELFEIAFFLPMDYSQNLIKAMKFEKNILQLCLILPYNLGIQTPLKCCLKLKKIYERNKFWRNVPVVRRT